MPPHGHHHHGGGGRVGPPGWFGPISYSDPYPAIEIVTEDSSTKQILQFIATLPKNQRAKAYQHFFGKMPPAGMLGDDVSSNATIPLIIGAVLLYFVFLGEKHLGR